jgi:hypothetical protein
MRIRATMKVAILNLAVLGVFTTNPARLVAADHQTKEVLTGSVVGIGGRFGGTVIPFTLTLEGRTSGEEISRDIQILRDKGQDGLLKELNHQKLGRFAVTGEVGREINLVTEHRTSDGRKITFVFERWLHMFELRYGTRSEDYPFTYGEIYLPDDGKGEGTLVPAAKIYFDDKEGNTVSIENFGIYPARLSNIELQTK